MEFENAAFGIVNKGDVLAPIKTQYGWHIIKLIDKEPLKDFESLKAKLISQVKRDSRSKLINSAMVKELSQRYKVKKDPNTRTYFKSVINDSYFAGKLDMPADFNNDAVVISVNDSLYTNSAFVQFSKSKQRDYMRKKTTVKKVIDTELNLFYE